MAGDTVERTPATEEMVIGGERKVSWWSRTRWHRKSRRDDVIHRTDFRCHRLPLTTVHFSFAAITISRCARVQFPVSPHRALRRLPLAVIATALELGSKRHRGTDRQFALAL